ncbi:MAG: hypothetical protein R3C13_03630 [Hyphomonas sp.]|uniref:hypothetical protein n=1 Tax=Hyphomonas sp. TaxID=87 RepID=UPI003527273B
MFVSWAMLRHVGATPIVRATVLMPFVGYLIVFNAQIGQWLSLIPDLDTSTANSKPLTYLNGQLRLILIYYALVLLGLGTAVYQIYCPGIIKSASNASDFTQEQLADLSDSRVLVAGEAIRTHRNLNHASAQSRVATLLSELNLTDEHLGSPAIFQKAISNSLRSQRVTLFDTLYCLENWNRRWARTAVSFLYAAGFTVLLLPTLDIFQATFRIALSYVWENS